MIPVEAWRSSTARKGAGTDTRPLRSILFANVDRKTATSTSARASTKSLRERHLNHPSHLHFVSDFNELPLERAERTRIGTPYSNHGTLWRVHGTIWVINGNLCVFLGSSGFQTTEECFRVTSVRLDLRFSSRILFMICSHLRERSNGAGRPFPAIRGETPR